MRVATKFGEHWDAARGEPYVDHSFDALRRSLDGSLARLGRIDFLQLHKTTPHVLRSGDLARAWEYAASLGVARHRRQRERRGIGRTWRSADRGIPHPAITLQRGAGDVRRGLEQAAARGMLVAVNRPFGMGRMLYENRELTKADGLRLHLAETLRRSDPERHEIGEASGGELDGLRRSAARTEALICLARNAPSRGALPREFRSLFGSPASSCGPGRTRCRAFAGSPRVPGPRSGGGLPLR